MAKGRNSVSARFFQGLGLLRLSWMTIAMLVGVSAVVAQTVDAPTPKSSPSVKGSSSVKERFLVSKYPDKPSVPPTLSVPIDTLGFSAPGEFYLGTRITQASLDFLGEDRLLFTFRVPGLLHRDAGSDDASDERKIRAVVIKLPQGTIETQTEWTLHDRLRYLWMLGDDHFLLRDRNLLSEGDATLALKPLLEFPGPLISIELDPKQRYLVADSHEPEAKADAVADKDKAGQVASPATASASVKTDDDTEAKDLAPPDYIVRILRRDSGQVMLVSRTRAGVHLPMNSAGYVENLRGEGLAWILSMKFFSGGSHLIGYVDSSCMPTDDFISDELMLITSCASTGDSKLMAMTTDGRTLWKTDAPSTEVWPRMVGAQNGLRLAWETLDLNHTVTGFAPIGTEDVKAQSVTVFDAATGDIALVAPLSPILDAGGNVAISASGRRVALLNAGTIQVFDLPAPPDLTAITPATSTTRKAN